MHIPGTLMNFVVWRDLQALEIRDENYPVIQSRHNDLQKNNILANN